MPDTPLTRRQAALARAMAMHPATINQPGRERELATVIDIRSRERIA